MALSVGAMLSNCVAQSTDKVSCIYTDTLYFCTLQLNTLYRSRESTSHQLKKCHAY